VSQVPCEELNPAELKIFLPVSCQPPRGAATSKCFARTALQSLSPAHAKKRTRAFAGTGVQFPLLVGP